MLQQSNQLFLTAENDHFLGKPIPERPKFTGVETRCKVDRKGKSGPGLFLSHNVILSTGRTKIVLETAAFEAMAVNGHEKLVGPLQHGIIANTMPNDLPDDLEATARP